MDGLRRTGAVVVPDVLGHDPTDVIGAEEDEVVQGLLPKRPIEPLDVRRGIRRAIGNGDAFDAYDLVEPTVEMTTVASLPTVVLHSQRPAVLTEDTVVVVDEEAGVWSRGVASRICCLTQGSVGLVVTLTWTMRREPISMTTKM